MDLSSLALNTDRVDFVEQDRSVLDCTCSYRDDRTGFGTHCWSASCAGPNWPTGCVRATPGVNSKGVTCSASARVPLPALADQFQLTLSPLLPGPGTRPRQPLCGQPRSAGQGDPALSPVPLPTSPQLRSAGGRPSARLALQAVILFRRERGRDGRIVYDLLPPEGERGAWGREHGPGEERI